MQKSLSRASSRSISDLLCRYRSFEEGRKTVLGRLELLRNFVVSEGLSGFIFGAKSATEPLQFQIINALHLGERDKASKCLSYFSCRSDSLRANDFIHILDHCARSPDPLFGIETWRIMEEKEISMDKTCYMLIMQALTKGGYLEEALNLLTFLGQNPGSAPDLDMYNNFLNGCAKIGSMVHANTCLDLMENQMVGKSEMTYLELLKLAVMQKNLTAVHGIWKQYSTHYSPNITFLHELIRSFSKLGDLVSACEALQHAVALISEEKVSIINSFKGNSPSSRLDIPIPSMNGFVFKRSSSSPTADRLTITGAHDLRENNGDLFCGTNKSVTQVSAMNILKMSFVDVLYASAESGNCELVEQLFLQMQKLRLETSGQAYDCLIKVVVHERGVVDGLKLLKVMEETHIKPLGTTLAILSIACSKIFELDLAEALLDRMVENPCTSAFNALLAACDILDQPERAVCILAKMKQLKLKFDIRTYELLFSLFGTVNAPYERGNSLSQADAAERINAIERDMERNGVQHSHSSLVNLLRALGAEGMIGELFQYLRMPKNQIFLTETCEGTTIYNIVLQSLVIYNKNELAFKVFRDMKLRGLPPDVATYNIMIHCCETLDRCKFRFACVFLGMMLREGFWPQAYTYTLLTRILARRNLSEALHLLHRMSSEGIHPDVQTYNVVLYKAYQKHEIEITEQVVKKMLQERIQPDPSTCKFVVGAYLHCCLYTTAVEALQVLSMRMISQDESVLQDERKYFEDNFILAKGPKAESFLVKSIKKSLVKNTGEYLATALLYLRLCAIAKYSITWPPDQSEWAKQLLSGNALESTIYSLEDKELHFCKTSPVTETARSWRFWRKEYAKAKSWKEENAKMKIPNRGTRRHKPQPIDPFSAFIL